MEFKRILLNNVLFAATTQDLNIPADNVKYLDMGIACTGVTTTDACALSDLSLSPIDEVQVTLGGEIIQRIHFMDLLALNTVWEDILPHFLGASGATSQRCKIEGVRLPLDVTKYGKALSVVFTHLADASLTPCNIHASYQYRQTQFPSHFNIQYKEHVAATAATDYEVSLDNAGCELIGLLLYSAIIQTAAAPNTRTIARVKVLVDDREIYDEDWHTMTKAHMGVDTVSDPTDWGPLLDEYRWLDFQQEPLPAGKLRLLYQSETDTGHTARFIPIYIEKNQSV